MKFQHEQGTRVEDIITGFSGVVTGRVEYITGCNQYLVQPRVSESGESREPKWFDEQRLTVLDDTPITLQNDANGADEPAPIK